MPNWLQTLLAAASIVGTSLASPLADQVLSQRSESGPKLNSANFPDPSIIKINNVWYSFATRTIGSSIHIQVATSQDFNTWSIVKNADGSQFDALPNLPTWALQSDPNTWAPDVHQLADGSFVMTYSATVASSTAHHCVGVAKSKTILGPYTPTSNTALVCPLNSGGAIDSSFFRDPSSNQLYLLYKIDGNSLGSGGPCNQNPSPPYVPTPIKIQPLNADGVSFQYNSQPTTLLSATQADDGIVEAPSLAKIGNFYYLFYSPGCFTTQLYSVSYAYSSSLMGPYSRGTKPLFKSGDAGGLSGPGGASIYEDDGKHLLFHANVPGGRALYTAVVSANNGVVTA